MTCQSQASSRYAVCKRNNLLSCLPELRRIMGNLRLATSCPKLMGWFGASEDDNSLSGLSSCSMCHIHCPWSVITIQHGIRWLFLSRHIPFCSHFCFLRQLSTSLCAFSFTKIPQIYSPVLAKCELCGSKAFHVYSGGTRFESWPGDRLSWLRYFLVFPLFIDGRAGIVFQLRQNCFLLSSFQFIIIHLSPYRPVLLCVSTERVINLRTG